MRRFVEALEGRVLLANEPWGAFPQLIDQDLAVSKYPQYNGANQTIAVIDTGVDYTHPAMSGNYLAGYDFIDNDNDPRDDDGHGTAQAVTAVGNQFVFNGSKYQGVATGARVVALRVDGGGFVPDSRYEAAFQWIIDNRATYNIVAVNASFGGGHHTTEAQRASYADEMETLIDLGVFIVASSGNDGAQSPFGIEYPAADPSVFAAGSVNTADRISNFTERGAIMDILAPGENVPVAYLDQNGDHIYTQGSGTSFSAPYIAGAAAILKQIDPNFTPRDIMSILRASGVDNLDGDTEANPRTNLSWPRLDLDNAIALALVRKSGQASAANVGNNGRQNALQYDRDGVLYNVWHDVSNNSVKFATRSTAGFWSAVQTIDANPNVGHYVTMAMTSTGKPALAYYDAANADLKYAEFTGAGWSVQRVDAKNTTGLYPSLAFDSFDDPLITYYYKNGGDLKFAINEGDGWQISFVEQSQDVGRYSSLAISSSGQIGVAYENTTLGRFKFARRSGSSWVITTVDSDTEKGGGYISLAYDSSNNPGFSYYDARNADLKFARFNGSSWSTETVASQFSQGLYSTLFFDDNGDADILYFHKSLDAVFRATGTIGNWSIGQLVGGGGRHAFYARRDGSPRIFSWYESASADLEISTF